MNRPSHQINKHFLKTSANTSRVYLEASLRVAHTNRSIKNSIPRRIIQMHICSLEGLNLQYETINTKWTGIPNKSKLFALFYQEIIDVKLFYSDMMYSYPYLKFFANSKQYYLKRKQIAKLDQNQQNILLMHIENIQKLKHPNIGSLVRYTLIPNMELMMIAVKVDGQDLNNLVQNFQRQEQELSEAQIKIKLKQVVEAIVYSHSNYAYHQNIKFSNIIINSDFKIKIVDYLLESIQYKYVRQEINIKPPEQLRFRNNGYSPYTDVWQIGVLMYKLFYSAYPFEGSNAQQKLKNIKNLDYEFPNQKQSQNATDLMQQIFQTYDKRISLQQILQHKWFQEQKQIKFFKQVFIQRVQQENNLGSFNLIKKSFQLI